MHECSSGSSSIVVKIRYLLAVCLISTTLVSQAKTPVSAFARLPPIRDVVLSPDGTKAVILRAIEETYHVTVADFSTRKSQLVMAANPKEFLFNWCHWANNERIVCSIRSYITLRAGQVSAGYRWYTDGRVVVTRLLAVNADGSNAQQLIPEARNRVGKDLEWTAQSQDGVISWMTDDPDSFYKKDSGAMFFNQEEAPKVWKTVSKMAGIKGKFADPVTSAQNFYHYNK